MLKLSGLINNVCWVVVHQIESIAIGYLTLQLLPVLRFHISVPVCVLLVLYLIRSVNMPGNATEMSVRFNNTCIFFKNGRVRIIEIATRQ